MSTSGLAAGDAGELARFGAIAKVAIEKGFGHYAARRLREALEALGPAFVKFGQMLSMKLGGACAQVGKAVKQGDVMHDHSQHAPAAGGEPRGGVRYGRWIFGGFVAIALYFLITEHRAHVVQLLPFVLLLACPLLHMFHGHGGHGGHRSKQEGKREEGKP